MEKRVSLIATDSLCARCSTIDFNMLHSLGLSSEPLPEFDLGPVTNWAVDSCRFCRFLATQIPPKYLADSQKVYRLKSALNFTSSLSGLFRSVGGTWLQLYPMDNIFQHLTTQSNNSRPGRQLRLLEMDHVDFDVFRRWLSFCHKSHLETCCSSSISVVEHLKLIDCQTLKIVPARNEQYVTLSYMWGPPPHETLHADPMPSQLPNTIMDAIVVTQQLGFRYLWIDRYCINQQNQSHAIHQIQQMGSIYKNSEITIIAASGTDPSYGLPGIGARHRILQPHTTIGEYLFISTLHTADSTVKNSVWNTRGWTYQEALLSRRRLIFIDEQVYFECESMYCYEIFDIPVQSLPPPKNESLQLRSIREIDHLLRIFPFRMNNTKITVFDLVEQYSLKSLTKSTDRLNGFLGILEYFQSSPYSLQSFWGTPIAQNNTHLLYSEQRSIQTDEEKHSLLGFISGLCWLIYKPIREKSLPSWSWVGWTGEVEFPFMIDYEPNSDAPPVNIRVELSTSDSTVDEAEAQHFNDKIAVLRGSTPDKVLDWDESRRRYPKMQDQFQYSHYIHITASALHLEWIGVPFFGNDYIFHFTLSYGEDHGAYFRMELPFHTEVYEDSSDLSSFKFICLSEGSAEGDYVIFVMVIAKVADDAWERVGGKWLSEHTPVFFREKVEMAPLRAVYGDEWYKQLSRTYGTWRVR